MTAACEHRDLWFRYSQDQPAQRQMPSIPSFLPAGLAGRMIGGISGSTPAKNLLHAPRTGTQEPVSSDQAVAQSVLNARAWLHGPSIVISAVARSNRLILDNIRTRPRSNAATELNLVPRRRLRLTKPW